MKLLTREFTKREKILILALAVILVLLAYYRFVHIPVGEAISTATITQYQLQDEEVIAQTKAQKAMAQSSEMNALKSLDSIGVMPSYNGSKEELALLNMVLAGTDDYSVNFTTITREGNQIRRNFELSYVTPDFASAEMILANLENGGYRMLIDDVVMTTNDRRTGEPGINVSLNATFYETMVGGTPDAGLPEDSAAKEEASADVEEALY